jgi:anthranilate phosphoribosyltransferase
MITKILQKLVTKKDLTYEESRGIMKEIMSGKASNPQITALLTALRMKGETIKEITAFAEVMKEFCIQINPDITGRLVDLVGTGGDKIKTFNISTTAAFIAAGAGVVIAKHGNRSVTSKSGSADVLEHLGFNLKMEPEAVENAIQKIGVGFMYAPVFHPAMKYAAGPRRELGIRTVFNLLGPLTNPANANAQLVGVYDKKLTEPLAYTLKNLGCQEAMVVHGLDEISTLGKTVISWLKGDEVVTLEKAPKDFGLNLAKLEDVKGTTPKESAETTFKILNACYHIKDPKREIALVNGAAGIIIGGKAEDFTYGLEAAHESIESGTAYNKLKALIKASNGDTSLLEELELKYG